MILARRKKFGGSLIALAFGWLLLWSLPVASVPLRQGLERQFPQRAASDYPVVDAIVVLGGGIQGGRKGWRVGPHLLTGADRAWFGAQLYRAGRAPVLILSGGNSGWSTTDEPEAEAMEAFENDLGVPASAVLLEDRSRNTEENAQYTKQLMAEHRITKILLVTSAAHMPRALALFRAQGVDAIPAPTDFDAIPSHGALQSWLPDPEMLDKSSRAMKEYLAIGIYRLEHF
ncbi:MAG TPA: YdcF family protein [Rudaea sp.]|uniref:YdcF family protein n=1 Tax=Rudaea sp. TaxID=2136325 RepID=UPI002F937591